MKKVTFYIIPLFLLSILVGCAETDILDRVGLTTLVGYDVGTEERMSTTVVVREVNPEFQSNVEVITTENETSKGNRMKANRKLSKKITIGQMRVVLFGEELAKDDLHSYLDSLLENPSVSNSLYLAVVEGETSVLLEHEYKNIDDIGQHIYRLMEQNIKYEHMISSTLHEIAHDFYMVGKDSAIPIIKKEGELVELTGVAIFNDGKMVSSLSLEDSFYVKLLRDNFKSGIFETILKEEDIPPNLIKGTSNEMPVAFDAIKSKRELKLVDATTPEFDFQLKLKARLLEIYPDVESGDPKVIERLEDAMVKNLTREISRVIAHCQNVQSDIFGFGEKYRSSVRNSNLSKEKLHDMYKDMKVNIKVEFEILRDGVFE
ncbi:Ger(x)C family spore germination protein [Psychrobacillus sp. OK032]|uniref:Ger(x)C family spore germination protein n=1 Tax=Psychrobacillus sp. OK032 TaxID=1884358 RepID=UPI0008B34A86|nr:Ger(x)C family spore germination protein [Psychrobacillus sp. OK032]SES11089.1 spore germination protein [Psychrobacillus sp. OK032]